MVEGDTLEAGGVEGGAFVMPSGVDPPAPSRASASGSNSVPLLELHADSNTTVVRLRLTTGLLFIGSSAFSARPEDSSLAS
jgi:hypothetical protein